MGYLVLTNVLSSSCETSPCYCEIIVQEPQTWWPLLRTSCNSCEALGTLLCIQRSGGLGFVLYKLLMKMYHDDEDGSGTSNYDAVNTGNDNVIYIERDRTYRGR